MSLTIFVSHEGRASHSVTFSQKMQQVTSINRTDDRETFSKVSNNEHEKLLTSKSASSNDGTRNQRQSSQLEWQESSWTRWLHVLCACWITPLLSKGYAQSLTANDLDALPHHDKSSVLLNRLQSYDWASASTLRIVMQEFWKECALVGVLQVPFLITRVAQPLLIRQILLDIMNKQQSNRRAYLCAFFVFVCAIVNSSFLRQTTFQSCRIAARIRNALTGIIYARSLSMKTTLSQQLSNGPIINLIINDTKKFEDTFTYMHYLWEGPLEAVIIFGLLCWIMKPIPTLLGYIILISYVVLQLLFGRKLGQYRGTTVSCSDKRVHAFGEFVHGYQVIKMYNWETLIMDQIRQLRQNESASIQRASRIRTVMSTQALTVTTLIGFCVIGSAWLLGYPLNTIDALTTLSLVALMRLTLGYYFVMAIEGLSEVRSASKRIDSFVYLTTTPQQQDLRSSMPLIGPQGSGTIVMTNACFSWGDDKPCLSSLNLTIESSTLVGIVGCVGSGKSSLLAAILGEMNLTDGQCYINGSLLSYAAQSPWIFADTIRNNILLNQTFDSQRYRDVIHACCLDVDLSLLGPSGDLTVIGERGVNLSGGQKARISLARALYANADIYLIDDPLAAVDRTVAKQIYDRCMGANGLLKTKTRLLITHQTQLLSEAHRIIFLSHGHIDEQGHLDEHTSPNDTTEKDETSPLADVLHDKTSILDIQPIIVEERSMDGRGGWLLWSQLLTAPPTGKFGLCLLLVLLLLGQLSYDGTNYWLSRWFNVSNKDQQYSPKFAYIYFGMTITTLLVNFLRIGYFFQIALQGADHLHNNMLAALLHTSIQFFETNPSGRILNRAGKDQQIIDEVLPRILLESLISLLMSLGSIVIICFVNAYVLLLFIALIPVIYFLCQFYLRSCHQLKQLENTTRSPIYDLFSSSLDGLTTIRAFNAKDSFIPLLADRIDTNTRAYISMHGAMQWLAIRLDFAMNLIMFTIIALVVTFHEQLELSAAALTLTYAINVSTWIQWTIRQLLEVAMMMTSAERVHQYAQLPPEDDQGGYQRLVKTPPIWPTRGTLEFRNYSLRHRAGLGLTLTNVNVRIESGQKIGIIGRTGAGKSSLFKGVFRLIPRSNVEGQILLDDVDISRVTLKHLRSKLSVIPQQPILFSGTLRCNLDPLNHYSDDQCWMALEDVQLKQYVSEGSAGLLMPIIESGSNLSVGQCQLICIARAMLKKSKILLIDEATANVDKKTEEIIQEIMSSKLQDRTILSIAHRWNTVAQCDRILVVDNGNIVNFDTPMNVIENYPDSSLCQTQK